MKIKIVNKSLISIRTSKDYEIQLSSGETIIINKWVDEVTRIDNTIDNGWNIINGNNIFNALPQNEKDKVVKFILYININD